MLMKMIAMARLRRLQSIATIASDITANKPAIIFISPLIFRIMLFVKNKFNKLLA